MEKGKAVRKITVSGVEWTPAKVKASLQGKDENVVKALMVLYGKQTEHERMVQSTEESNGVGFNGVDAPILTSFAEQYKTRNFLSKKQIELARKKLLKYSRQIFEIIVESRQQQFNKFGL